MGTQGWVPGLALHGTGTAVLGTSHISPRQWGTFCSWLETTVSLEPLGSPSADSLRPEVAEHPQK